MRKSRGVAIGELWWADFDERRAVVFVSTDAEGHVVAMLVVPPADIDITGIAVEVALGSDEGLPEPGVVRVALLRPGRINCAWLVTLARSDLIERVGKLVPAKVAQLEHALRVGGLDAVIERLTAPTTAD